MVEALGWISFYGYTPSIDFFKNSNIDPADDDRDINVLLSECSDLRHVFRSLCDMIPLKFKKPREHKLNIYIHEKNGF